MLPKTLSPVRALRAQRTTATAAHAPTHRARARVCAAAIPRLQVWIVPGMLEVFSLPPFLGDLEFSLLLFTLRSYPNGLPADERLIDPAGTSPDRRLAGGGRLPRTPISFSSGSVVRAARTH